jgi:hypothetical protein
VKNQVPRMCTSRYVKLLISFSVPELSTGRNISIKDPTNHVSMLSTTLLLTPMTCTNRALNLLAAARVVDYLQK